MHDAIRVLPRFVAFMEKHQAPNITTRLALEWVLQANTVQPAERARRLGFIRGFARYGPPPYQWRAIRSFCLPARNVASNDAGLT